MMTMKQHYHPTNAFIRTARNIFLPLLLLTIATFAQQEEEDHNDEEEAHPLPSAFLKHQNLMNEARQSAKPSILLPANLLGTELPVSPITLTILSLTILWCIYILQRSSTALVSHILLEGPDDDALKNKLTKYKEEIQNNAEKFGTYAQLYSTCPSGKNNKGSLGWIKQGVMVFQFDQICFNKNMGLRECLGPVQTEFGWHLIWIQERKICSW
uniref:Peptidyl-prolyl cis-trans isomerase n=1 Tax=Helicotheca tamesis TaxID=374047 RepID=A0A7S2HXM6_9STRA|mmetsp:Transcript_3361/g.4563  ORF Transcript_3361/g.4563 Transcript_3361/m.4563 type:complete len:213 (+) Transcript_3361:52-690(+)